MSDPIAGRVFLVTGPARGIGEETARQLAARGARLSLVGLEAERLAALAAELGEGHLWFEADVTDQAALQRAARETAERLGGIDGVVANAGIASHGTVAVAPVEAQVRTLEVNLVGVLRTVTATLPYLLERRGQYVLISSAAAFSALPGMAAYAASKAGVEQLGNVLRLELAHRGVAVCTVHPAWIETDLMRDVEHDLSSVRRVLRTLPGPYGVRSTVQACAAAIVRGIERRERRVFIPRSLALFALLRQVLNGRLSEWLVGRRAGDYVPALEREVQALGRAFGEHSVGGGDRP